MIFEKNDINYLNKLKIKDILSLALTIPKEYNDTYLHTYIKIDKINTIDAFIQNVEFKNSRLKLTIFAKNLNTTLTGIYFKPLPFHKKIFFYGAKLYLMGKITKFNNSLFISQPKIVKEINKIIPIYKTSLKEHKLKELIKKYLTYQNLKKSGLEDIYIKNLLELHFPKHSIEINNYIKILKYVEIFRYLSRLKSKKKSYKANYSCKGKVDEFINSLPFKLTNDQKKVIYELQNDLTSTTQKRRVIIGDVGCGKTMVMLSVAFMSKKSIIMAPTTILANQIYQEAKKFLRDFNIVLHTNKTNIKEKELNVADLIIGTHALLYTKLPTVCSIMIDEQHRFGTNQRQFLSNLSSIGDSYPHFFQFSATPIPRTQALIESTIVDVSFIKEMPFKKDITTKIITKQDFSNLLSHIKGEILKNHQVLIIYPLVEKSDNFDYQSIEEAKEFWYKKFDNVYHTHGKDKDKDKILQEFKEKGSILLATTVVEVGISLPRLSTIIISGAERLGLATLHQLRGRVSRTGLKGYCFLYTNIKESKRLRLFCNTTNGFEVAELDLKFRKSGDLIDGAIQSGEEFKFFDMSEDYEIIKEQIPCNLTKQ